MRLIGLTGGIGSGKSSVSSRLAERGAIVVDADAIVRELQQPGEPVFQAMVERWGSAIVAEDGTLDRAAVAGIVFADEEELQAIEAMIHPEVRKESERRINSAGPDQTVILDNPLLVESVKKARAAKERGEHPDHSGGSAPVPQAIIVIDTPTEVAIERLVTFRGLDEADAKARMANQVSRDERLKMADFVIDNSGDLEALEAEVIRCWEWLQTIEPRQ